MELKGKEFDIGGVRIQVDPLVVGRRVLVYRLRLLIVVALAGGLATAGTYLSMPKIYESRASIAVRTEALGEDYVHRLLNTAMRDVASNEELMLVINELNLFPETRARLPYEMALKHLRSVLRLGPEPGSIGVAYESRDPKEAQRVVAFVTERVLAGISELLDSPYARSLEALDRGIKELAPKVREAQRQLFAFQAAHPEIVIRPPEFSAVGSPLQDVEAQISAAETDMKRCFSGGEVRPTAARAAGPACIRLREMRQERDQLLQQFTESHPAVTRMNAQIQVQKGRCDKEEGATVEGDLRPGMTPEQCRVVIAARIQKLHARKAELEKTSIKKPELQGEWAKVSAEANQLESQYRALLERRARTVEDRLLAANSFQENFQLVDPPRVPGLPSKPDRNRLMGLGMLLTAMVGLGLAALLEAFRQTFNDPREVEEQAGLTVLAELPPIRSPKR